MLKKVNFKVDDQSFEGMIVAKDFSTKSNFVFLHGAGLGNKERVLSFAEYLVDRGVSIVTFDQSGAGKDAANLKASSLAKRALESKAAIERFADQDSLTVCGSSMGGYIALKMLEYFDVKNLVLFCPAIYASKAYNVPFGDGFTETIRQPESWRDSDVLYNLEQFKGSLLIIIGEKDDVIPPGVIDLIYSHASKAAKREIIRIPEAPHKIHVWLGDHPDIALQIANKISEYIL